MNRNTNNTKDHNVFIGVEKRIKGKKRIISDKSGIFGLHTPPKMEEETTRESNYTTKSYFWPPGDAASAAQKMPHLPLTHAFFLIKNII